MNQKRKVIAIVLSFVFLLSNFQNVIAKNSNDIIGHWSEKWFSNWISQGLINGYGNNTYKPDAFITRAEFAALVNNVICPQEMLDIRFEDVKDGIWFEEDVKKAATIGYMEGYQSGKIFSPNDLITRQEAAMAIFKLLRYDNSEGLSTLSNFTDNENVSDWAKEALTTIVKKGIFIGNNNMLRPLDNITRAEAVIALNRLFGTIYNTSGTYEKNIEGNATIVAKDTILKNVTINGDLYLSEGIGDGDVTLDGVSVTGDIYVKGGGINSVKVKDSTVMGKMTVTKQKGDVRIEVSGNTSIKNVGLKSGCKLEEKELVGNGFSNVTIEKMQGQGDVVLEGEFDNLRVKEDVKGKISLQKASQLGNLEVEESSLKTEVAVSKESKIKLVIANKSLTVNGEGTVSNAIVNGEDIKFEIKVSNIIVKEKGKSLVVNGEKVETTKVDDKDALNALMVEDGTKMLQAVLGIVTDPIAKASITSSTLKSILNNIEEIKSNNTGLANDFNELEKALNEQIKVTDKDSSTDDSNSSNSTGNTGSTGSTGDTGNTGSTGSTGDTGNTGSTGDTGNNNSNDGSNNGTANNSMPVISFEDGLPSFINNVDSQIEVVNEGATQGNSALKVTYGIAEYPTVKFKPELVWNWGQDNCLALDVTNTTDKVQKFYIRVDDDVTANGQSHSTVSVAEIQPNKTESIYMSFSSNTLDIGMRGVPSSGAGRNIGHGWGEKNLNTTNITEFQFWMMSNKSEATLIFDNIRVLPDPGSSLSYLDNIVDEFGQYNGLDWSGKVKSEQDLLDDKAQEAVELSSATSALTDVSKYGGWTVGGAKQSGTGYFTTYYDEVNKKWSLIDPEGYLFFATGVDTVRFGDAYTWIDGRRDMFSSLPEQNGSLGDHYSYAGQVARAPLGLTEGWIYNFYTANLERKYGENYKEEWKNVSLKRFKNWGFTTLGNWSDADLFFGKGEDNKIVYTANGWINGNHAKLDSGSPYWGPIADPFDPEFTVSTHNMTTNLVSYGINDDPWCMGVYVDNEIAWGNPTGNDTKYAVVVGAFAKDAANEDSYAKRAFIEKLKEKYNNDIANLNAVWNTSIDTWSTLEAPYSFSGLNAGKVGDLSILLGMLADKYYSIVDAELSEHLPNMLNLGSRFAEWGTSLEVQEACAKYVDVVSFNVYKEGVKGEDWIKADVLGKPCIVGEFHFGSTDRGMFAGGLVSAKNQADRGVMYKDYLTTVINSPYFVGAHWFQYIDQPLTGRAWDGENYNTGFTDVTDIPYTNLVDAAKEIHSQMYRLRYGKIEVTGVELDKTEAAIDAATPTLQLTATILPNNADFKGIVWSSSDDTVATVNENGLVTAKMNGVVDITAKSEDNTSISTTCKVTITGFASALVTMPNISFEESEDLGIVSAYKEATVEYVTDGATDGSRAIKVNVGKLDADYSGIQFIPKNEVSTWNWGVGTTFSADITNPNNEAIQVRANIVDSSGTYRTYYFGIAENSTKTIEIDNLGPQTAYWGDDGWFFGDNGINQAEIALFNMYLWEDKPNTSSNIFIVDNIKVVNKGD